MLNKKGKGVGVHALFFIPFTQPSRLTVKRKSLRYGNSFNNITIVPIHSSSYSHFSVYLFMDWYAKAKEDYTRFVEKHPKGSLSTSTCYLTFVSGKINFSNY